MTIDEIHKFLKFLKNDGQGGWFSSVELDSAINRGSSAKYDEERQLFERTGHISANLGNFRASANITFTTGFGPLPGNYGIITAAENASGLRADIVPDSEWVDVVNDPIDVPSSSNIKLAMRPSGYAAVGAIEVRPTSVTSAKIYYLRLPATAVWGYDEVAGNFVYNSGLSTQLDWPSTCHEDIVLRAAAFLGVPLSDGLIMNLKAFKKQTEGV